MLDSRYLRADIEEAAQRLAKRKFTLDVAKLTELETLRKDSMTRTQDLQAQRNSLSKSIGQAIKAGQDVEPIKAQVAEISKELEQVKAKQDEVLKQINDIALRIPNLPDDSCPLGEDETFNVEV